MPRRKQQDIKFVAQKTAEELNLAAFAKCLCKPAVHRQREGNALRQKPGLRYAEKQLKKRITF